MIYYYRRADGVLIPSDRPMTNPNLGKLDAHPVQFLGVSDGKVFNEQMAKNKDEVLRLRKEISILSPKLREFLNANVPVPPELETEYDQCVASLKAIKDAAMEEDAKVAERIPTPMQQVEGLTMDGQKIANPGTLLGGDAVAQFLGKQ